MNTVMILMSTYNGERYLTEQLDSIYAQKGVDIHLLVRDDGSTDRTLCILQDYASKNGKMTIYNGDNLGASKSFCELLRFASEYKVKFDYYAYSDQDDVWFEDKLLAGVEALERNKAFLKMSFSDFKITNDKLIPFKEQTCNYLQNCAANIISNHIAGCCQLFNYNLLLKVNLINNGDICTLYPKLPFFHDSWTSAVAFALNAYIYHDNNPRMYYRQHGNNVVGVHGNGVISILTSRMLRYIKPSTHSKSSKCQCLISLLGDEIPLENKQFLKMCAQYRYSTAIKLKLLLSPKLYSYGITENIGAFILVLLNKF